MEGPVYVYYGLEKFFQNHRSYVKSRSSDQLKGGVSKQTLKSDGVGSGWAAGLVLRCGSNLQPVALPVSVSLVKCPFSLAR